MAPYILGNHQITNGEVTATYVDKEGEPTDKLEEAKIFDSRLDLDKYAVARDIEANAIIVKGETK
ncbi:hypothetical protein CAL7716_100790 (plasmid) [Calothrix sp. PCC 7716]|nr:hypothetical protein CAL7716_100790 [Calothrix sp. PCC 7716]